MKKQTEKKEILLIHPGLSSFVKKDISILSTYYSVNKIHYVTSKKLFRNIVSQISLLFQILPRIIKSFVFFIWFADYHAFLPVLLSRVFGKKSIIVLGGYDVTYLPELKYGSFSNPIRKFCTSYALRGADYLLAVDSSLIDELNTRIKSLRGESLTVPTSFDSTQWFRSAKKDRLVLTVGICDSFQRYKLKGIDIFVEVARLLPRYEFLVIGMKENMIKRLDLPENLHTRDYVTFSELRDYYSRAKVYAQFSIREGLPSVVCEAMLCESVPVGCSVNGISTAIGDCGFLLAGRDPVEGAKLVKKAMESPAELGEKARQRIISLFNTERREKSLVSILGSF
ncbi:MAG: glycosyltransferase family 4 protein [bacterium]|nr:MAG: glycosyltransferase family 4 protein [bacterium]